MNTNKNTRRAARTIIVDEEINKIAILEVKGGDYHKIPGGGVEKNESLEEAALREAIEEGSSDVKLIAKLGEIEFEEPDNPGYFNHSICFLARKTNSNETLSFTEDELSNQFRLLWLSFDEAIYLFENVKSSNQYDIKMNNRDLEFVIKAKEHLEKKYIPSS